MVNGEQGYEFYALKPDEEEFISELEGKIRSFCFSWMATLS